jgi:hypothetical protein
LISHALIRLGMQKCGAYRFGSNELSSRLG